MTATAEKYALVTFGVTANANGVLPTATLDCLLWFVQLCVLVLIKGLHIIQM